MVLTTDGFDISEPMLLLTTASFVVSEPLSLLTTDNFRLFSDFLFTDN